MWSSATTDRLNRLAFGRLREFADLTVSGNQLDNKSAPAGQACILSARAAKASGIYEDGRTLESRIRPSTSDLNTGMSCEKSRRSS
jgi:hypothetical protein